MDAKSMSEAIRMKRKKVKEGGVENMVDTAPGPQMNPQDILNMKMKAQRDATMKLEDKSMAPDDPADADIKDTSQSEEYLKRHMARVAKIRPSWD